MAFVGARGIAASSQANVFAVGCYAVSPLIALAIYLWSLGAKLLPEEFPPPGYRVICDTRIVAGQSAVMRGRGLKVLALGLDGISALLWLLLWRLVRTLSGAAVSRLSGITLCVSCVDRS